MRLYHSQTMAYPLWTNTPAFFSPLAQLPMDREETKHKLSSPVAGGLTGEDVC